MFSSLCYLPTCLFACLCFFAHVTTLTSYVLELHETWSLTKFLIPLPEFLKVRKITFFFHCTFGAYVSRLWNCILLCAALLSCFNNVSKSSIVWEWVNEWVRDETSCIKNRSIHAINFQLLRFAKGSLHFANKAAAAATSEREYHERAWKLVLGWETYEIFLSTCR